jgi:hypothetical protein
MKDELEAAAAHSFFFFHLRNVDLLSGSDTAQSIILFLNQDTFSILLYR